VAWLWESGRGTPSPKRTRLKLFCPLSPCLAPSHRKQPTSAVNDSSVKVETITLRSGIPFPGCRIPRPGSPRSSFRPLCPSLARGLSIIPFAYKLTFKAVTTTYRTKLPRSLERAVLLLHSRHISDVKHPSSQASPWASGWSGLVLRNAYVECRLLVLTNSKAQYSWYPTQKRKDLKMPYTNLII
jgi:hypothetical protein